MAVITLTTDFGQSDGYAGIMKGVILRIAPAARLVDLGHDLAPQGVMQAAYVLRNAAPYFPDGTIHLAVVDPGVGGSRRPLLVTTPRATYVGPDNGLFTFALDESGAQAWRLDRPSFWLPSVSRTFHGRDIFAPVAAHLACGVPVRELASPVEDPVRLTLPVPVRRHDGAIIGAVMYVDRFGNLRTNIPGAWVAGRPWRCQIAQTEIATGGLTYASVSPGAFLALVGSAGDVEIAMRDGNAAVHLGVGIGEPVLLWVQA